MEIGPYAVIGPHVAIGSGTTVGPHVIIDGWTVIGERNQIFAGAAIGGPPQDLKYKGEQSHTLVGNDNIFREYVTIHRASDKGGVTKVGDKNLFMAYVHVAHNCIMGSEVIVASYTGFSGHVEVEDQAVIGGLVGVHQFARIGRLAMVGGMSAVRQDIPPYVMVEGSPMRHYGINSRGLQRRGFSTELRLHIKRAYKILTDSKFNLSEAVEEIKRTTPPGPEIRHLLEFLQHPSKMGILQRR